MKYILLSAFLLAVASCGDDFGDLNVDPNNPSKVPADFLLTNAEKSLASNLIAGQNTYGGGLLFSQYWAQNNYTDESRYLIRPYLNNIFWSWWYSGILYDFREIQRLVSESGDAGSARSNNQIAVVKILEAVAFQCITDVWGPAPYSEALLADKNRSPKYDSQKDVYLGLVGNLQDAIARMDVGAESFGSSDIIYNGDMEKWKRFAHSLLLRLAIRMSDVEAATAKDLVEANYAQAFSSNADNAAFTWLDGQPNSNPLNQQWVARGDADFGLSNILIDKTLKPLNDPRLYVWADERQNGGGYAGRPYGQNSGTAAGDAIENYSQPSGSAAFLGLRGFRPTDILGATTPNYLMHYAEVCFILAEAKERGWNVAGTAASWYDAGITASMNQWGVSDQAAIDTYLAQNAVNYATAPGDWHQKIGVQKWLALFMQGVEGWSEWRRLDFEKLELPVDGVIVDVGDKPAPSRISYPTNEQTQNANGYNQGVSLLGGPDKLSTRVWWDVK
ncbi:MAG: SusD/RagB family nutrient-binding outer membrane lipoprotein [Saprospiraceae bacterium]|nr:MAG: SusD/RagB family nutrient-binding outer membrane lipoprotein [Saprospiraceae bacterium]